MKRAASRPVFLWHQKPKPGKLRSVAAAGEADDLACGDTMESRSFHTVEGLLRGGYGSDVALHVAHNTRTVTSLPVSCAGPSGLRSGLPNCGELISKTSPILVSIFLMKLPVAAPKKCTCTSPG